MGVYNVIVNDESDKKEEFYTVDISDFNLKLGAYGSTIGEALDMAKSVILFEIEDRILKNEEVKCPLSYKEVKKHIQNDKQFIATLDFDYNFEMAKVKKTIKNKTVTLPVWLDMLAQEKKLNFSQILQRALKKELGIKE